MLRDHSSRTYIGAGIKVGSIVYEASVLSSLACTDDIIWGEGCNGEKTVWATLAVLRTYSQLRWFGFINFLSFLFFFFLLNFGPHLAVLKGFWFCTQYSVLEVYRDTGGAGNQAWVCCIWVPCPLYLLKLWPRLIVGYTRLCSGIIPGRA